MEKKSPNPIDKYVGSRIRMRRLMMKMSQEKLATAIMLTFQQVQKYEKGTNRVGASRLQQIAGVLQVPPAYFFEGAPAPLGATQVGTAEPIPDYVADFLGTADGLRLMKAFVEVTNPRLRRSIVDFVREIVPAKD